MSAEALLIEFRYLALIVGLLFEGEVVLLLAAFLAHQGYLYLPVVIVLSFLVTYSADLFFFWVGHNKGKQFLAKRPNWAHKVEKAKALVAGNLDLLVLGFRFMYGLRVVLPVVIGMSGIRPRRFAILNFFSAIVWTVGLCLVGYLFGNLAEVWLADVHRYEGWIIAGALLLGVGIWLYSRFAPKNDLSE